MAQRDFELPVNQSAAAEAGVARNSDLNLVGQIRGNLGGPQGEQGYFDRLNGPAIPQALLDEGTSIYRAPTGVDRQNFAPALEAPRVAPSLAPIFDPADSVQDAPARPVPQRQALRTPPDMESPDRQIAPRRQVTRPPAEGAPQDVPAPREMIGREFRDRAMPNIPPAESGRLPSSMVPTVRHRADWMPQHEALVKKAQHGNVDVAFYGDSITQAMGINSDFKKLFGPNAANFGIGGDRTQDLLWRLQHGEADFKDHQPDKAVLLIGTNNIDPANSRNDRDIARGIVADVNEMQRKMPNTEILVVGILPRGQEANSSLRGRINAINEEVQQALQGRENVHYTDIGSSMINSQGSMRSDLWQKDRVHPTFRAGYSAMFRAIKTQLDQLDQQRADQG